MWEGLELRMRVQNPNVFFTHDGRINQSGKPLSCLINQKAVKLVYLFVAVILKPVISRQTRLLER